MDHVGWLSLGPRAHFLNFYRESSDENTSAQNWLRFVVVFAQGFSAKVKMSFFAFLRFLFSHKDSLEKWR